MPSTAPYGSWPTTITSEVIVASAVGLSEVAVDGDDVIWDESRPEEGGRIQLVRRSADGATGDLLPDGFNARTAVHEYGGAAWWVREGTVWFVNWSDQRLYRIDPGSEPVALTPEPEIARGDRYADGDLSPDGTRLICVREHHPAGGRGAVDVRNELVSLEPGTPGSPDVIISGPDFVAHPRFSPDGSRLCWLEWDHPNMPWDGTRLKVRALADGAETTIAGGPDESVLEPAWQADGSLVFISDRNGWWNLYRWSPDSGDVEPLVEIEAEIGVPMWVLGGARFATLGDGRLVFARWRDGYDTLAVRDRDGSIHDLDTPFTFVDDVRAARDNRVVVIAGSATAESAVVELALSDGAVKAENLRPARDLTRLGIAAEHISRPEHIDFETAGGATAHALFYAPAHPDYTAPEGELPPLLVHIHGGPTGDAGARLRLGTQYWTSRGFAVVDVNYRGSTGYGREYRNLLRDQWGVADVDDCLAAARHLAREGRVDAQRMCISGGSAGGFTVLAVLARADTPFAVGTNLFGVADLERMALDTHKFESRYLDGLIGPLPQTRERYVERSPLTHVDAFDRPLLVLQGAEDAVVPPNQSEMIVAALRTKGVPVAYVLFEGEQHGFRQAANIRRAYEAELSFYAQVLGFELPAAEGIEPVQIENFTRAGA
jgi:dipeptidyl aminopeptidase/acylaminoacyl peptidase